MAQLYAILEELGIAPLWVCRNIKYTSIQTSHRSNDIERLKSKALVLRSSLTEQRGKVFETSKIIRVTRSINTSDKAITPVKMSSEPRGLSRAVNLSRVDLNRLRPAYPLVRTVKDEQSSKASESTLEAETGIQSLLTLGWEELKVRVVGCTLCRLCERRTNTVFGIGDETADWMLVGEAPGELEDKQGKPFVGQSGKLLDNMLHALKLSRRSNLYITNVLKCRPPGNRNPGLYEVTQCEAYLKRQVLLLKPKVIIALGRFAAFSLLKAKGGITSLRGQMHEYEGVPVIVTYHPAYLLRSPEDKNKAWDDLCLARAVYRNRTVIYKL
ncbi:uracil-DNA glycosylase [Candidatus Vallotiella sp. (ex Adelges kitamiensis)]|uniref:uracil-DNA glycosylase n=1 Tax=Candidatus Vallotiella sp. (ex Adelges kitamiensis) TaxID=2864217 RepID=UPI001CE30F19|nr:uracil-DNA glycosylase [Candidatus Vallotia sp. (ex Adelges kitamiensis)]